MVNKIIFNTRYTYNIYNEIGNENNKIICVNK